jgi:hypothetical protein
MDGGPFIGKAGQPVSNKSNHRDHRGRKEDILFELKSDSLCVRVGST